MCVEKQKKEESICDDTKDDMKNLVAKDTESEKIYKPAAKIQRNYPSNEIRHKNSDFEKWENVFIKGHRGTGTLFLLSTVIDS